MSRKNIVESSPMVDNTELDYEFNQVLINHCLDIFHTPKPDLSKPDEIKACIDNYFQSCISKNLRPGNLGLYAALDLDKKQVFDLIHGKVKYNASPVSVELIKKACKTISLYRESLGAKNKISAPVLIFWQKNFDGLEDVQRMEITADNTPKADMTPEEIKAQIEQDIPLDVDYNEID